MLQRVFAIPNKPKQTEDLPNNLKIGTCNADGGIRGGGGTVCEEGGGEAMITSKVRDVP